jgi:predicted small secreted protein
MRTFNIAVVLAACGLLPACATVVRGTNQDVSIASEPPEALARLSNGLSCTTPCRLELDRQQDVTVTFTKPGYQPADAKIISRVRGSDYVLGIGGNFVAGGLLGAVVDASVGSLHSLEPTPLHVTLQPWGAAAAQPIVASNPVAPASSPIVSARRIVAANTAAALPTCDGIPGVPPGVSTYSIENGRGGFIFVCDDPSKR